MSEWMLVLLRSIVLFGLGLFLIRLMGKRQLSAMTPFNFVNYGVIALIIALTSLNIVKNLVLGIIGLAVWVLMPIGIEYLALRSKWLHDLVNGKPTILIKDGKVLEENLNQVRYTGEELLRGLRAKGAFNLADVEFAVMETTGDMNVLLKSDKAPVTSYGLGRKVAPQPAPQTVILDGNIIDEALSDLGLNRGWLGEQLEATGVTLANVFIGQADGSGDLYLDLFDDFLDVPQPKVKELLFANLKKAQADLTSFALETTASPAKETYLADAELMKQVIERLDPYLLK